MMEGDDNFGLCNLIEPTAESDDDEIEEYLNQEKESYSRYWEMYTGQNDDTGFESELCFDPCRYVWRE